MARVADVTSAFHPLTDGAATATRLAGDVQTGSLNQSQHLEGIARQIDRMRQATEKAAAGAQDDAKSGEELAGQAASLREIVDALAGIVGARPADGPVEARAFDPANCHT